jgi:LysM repeat protein
MLAAVAAAVALVILNAPRTTGGHRSAARPQAALPRVPPYWFVRPGDTYAEISAKTGLTVAELQAFNPDVDPLNLIPGERLNLWRHPPKPRPTPPGPMFWTVRPGQSFGSIAAKTGINIITLEQLNPRLKPASLQPGDRVRLRH